METRANYVLIGAFTLAGILGLLGFFVWLAQLELDRQYASFDILFDNVSGLSVGGDVRFNGVSVGQATSINLFEKDPSKVVVRVQVNADTPVKTDTEVQLRAQGVTGLSFIELDGGSPRAELLRGEDGEVPVIVAQRSIIQELSQTAPNLLAQANVLMNRAQGLFSQENVAHVSVILANLESASGSLDKALGEVSGMTDGISQAAMHFGDFTAQLNTLSPELEETLASARRALDAAATTLGTADTTFDGANSVIRDQVPPIMSQLGGALTTLDAAVAGLKDQGGATLGQIDTVAATADARLSELQATIEKLNQALAETQTAMAAVATGAGSVQTLVEGEGTALVTDLRGTVARANQALDSVNRLFEQDVPKIVADVSSATAQANATMDQLTADLKAASSGLPALVINAGRALHGATQTFSDARNTLASLDPLITDARGALATADTALGNANAVLETDVGPMAQDLRESAARLAASVTAASADIPAITAQLRSASERAEAVMAQVDSVVATAGPAVNGFATRGLPSYEAFASEARALVGAMDRLVGQIQRNPTRFILGNSLPEYSR